MGNRRDTSFWYDNLVDGGSLVSRFHTVFWLCVFPPHQWRRWWSRGWGRSWVWPWRKELFKRELGILPGFIRGGLERRARDKWTRMHVWSWKCLFGVGWLTTPEHKYFLL